MQRTHELWVATDSRGRFLVCRGTETTVDEVCDDLYSLLESAERNGGHIVVRLPATEVAALLVTEHD